MSVSSPSTPEAGAARPAVLSTTDPDKGRTLWAASQKGGTARTTTVSTVGYEAAGSEPACCSSTPTPHGP